MLNEFLAVAYTKTAAQLERDRVHNLLKQLPVEDLYKLATGELTKEAFLEPCAPGNPTWIDRFKNTPLFDQAVALEQEEIQVEMDDLQRRQQRRQEMPSDNEIWDLKDQLRLKKRLLELQVAQADVTGQPPPSAQPSVEAAPPAEAQGAGAPGPASPNPDKTAAYVEQIKMAEDMGRSLARADFKKEAFQRNLVLTGDQAGRAVTKIAASMSDVTPYALGHGILNPLLGSGPGALAGGAMVERGDDHGALKGGIYGGLTGATIYGLNAMKRAPTREMLLPYAGMGAAIGGLGGAIGGAHTGHRISQTHKRPDDKKKENNKEEKESKPSKEKEALDMNAMKGLGQGAFNFLKANRGAAIGAGLGAAGGMAAGLQKDQTGHRSIVGGLVGGATGALGGAALGHGAEHFAKAMGHGGSIGESLRASGRQVKYQAQQGASALHKAMGGVPLEPPGPPPVSVPGRVVSAASQAPTVAVRKPMAPASYATMQDRAVIGR